MKITLPLLAAFAVLIAWLRFEYGGLDTLGNAKATTAFFFVHHSMEHAFAVFKRDFGRFPTTEEGLHALSSCPHGLEGKWRGPYLDKVILDPWGHPYRYRSPEIKCAASYALWSLGPDGVPSDDDIGNWQ